VVTILTLQTNAFFFASETVTNLLTLSFRVGSRITSEYVQAYYILANDFAYSIFITLKSTNLSNSLWNID
jgi:hypothetical protein